MELLKHTNTVARQGVNMTKEHKVFLDDLQESGETNMFGAAPYLQEEFGLDKHEARAILKEWMESF